jgi:hypothetical protein
MTEGRNGNNRGKRGNDREENTEKFALGGYNIEEIFTPGVVQIFPNFPVLVSFLH